MFAKINNADKRSKLLFRREYHVSTCKVCTTDCDCIAYFGSAVVGISGYDSTAC